MRPLRGSAKSRLVQGGVGPGGSPLASCCFTCSHHPGSQSAHCLSEPGGSHRGPPTRSQEHPALGLTASEGGAHPELAQRNSCTTEIHPTWSQAIQINPTWALGHRSPGPGGWLTARVCWEAWPLSRGGLLSYMPNIPFWEQSLPTGPRSKMSSLPCPCRHWAHPASLAPLLWLRTPWQQGTAPPSPQPSGTWGGLGYAPRAQARVAQGCFPEARQRRGQ